LPSDSIVRPVRSAASSPATGAQECPKKHSKRNSGQSTQQNNVTAPDDIPSGLYLYELRTPYGTAKGKMLLAK
jgi:hypothetical protein